MINNRKVIALIPARSGSKRLPRKNVLPLQGKPLIAWSIAAGLESNYVDQVIVSTDCNEIANVARQYGAKTPFMRPSDISDDSTSMDCVIFHLLTELSVNDSDIVVILQPTSPLRLAVDIDAALDKLITVNCDSVVSLCECEHSPYWSNSLPNDGNMGTFIKEDVKGKRSQDLPTCYRLNGAVYVFTASSFIKNKGIKYNNNMFSIIMPTIRSVDIDNYIDFKLAEAILTM
ncbi:acylneuraminate cytidylyltransferase family protein [Shewanella sp. SG44-2]|uniref:acylneuraminate cytidylyltransferase family protein n=1 Tax=Shewanella sp. SG44-2 TaxID=2760962 RepID=UPI001601084C|nr:acylneuraminate cytidylyltransferase family protein [Shewanella sp. SG44-2]MBB1428510.1 acylneuraminate cytidylyltransferase family protein [Shewanella sp. SG44-2]